MKLLLRVLISVWFKARYPRTQGKDKISNIIPFILALLTVNTAAYFIFNEQNYGGLLFQRPTRICNNPLTQEAVSIFL